MEKAILNSNIRKASEAQMLKSTIASFKIEQIVVSDVMAKSALEKARLRFKRAMK